MTRAGSIGGIGAALLTGGLILVMTSRCVEVVENGRPTLVCEERTRLVQGPKQYRQVKIGGGLAERLRAVREQKKGTRKAERSLVLAPKRPRCAGMGR